MKFVCCCFFVPRLFNCRISCLFLGRPAGQVSFPVDFFEHTLQTNDVEFGETISYKYTTQIR